MHVSSLWRSCWISFPKQGCADWHKVLWSAFWHITVSAPVKTTICGQLSQTFSVILIIVMYTYALMFFHMEEGFLPPQNIAVSKNRKKHQVYFHCAPPPPRIGLTWPELKKIATSKPGNPSAKNNSQGASEIWPCCQSELCIAENMAQTTSVGSGRNLSYCHANYALKTLHAIVAVRKECRDISCQHKNWEWMGNEMIHLDKVFLKYCPLTIPAWNFKQMIIL